MIYNIWVTQVSVVCFELLQSAAKLWSGKVNQPDKFVPLEKWLDPILPPQDPLKLLLNGEHPSSKQSFIAIRHYVSDLQCISNWVNEIVEGNFVPFKIQGQGISCHGGC